MVLNKLKELATKHHTGYNRIAEASVSPVVNYKQVIVFPFNKEMHSLIRYQEMLRFNISGVYDTKYSGYVRSSTNDLLHINHTKNHIIQNVEEIECQSFDTLILGHTDQIDAVKIIKRLIDNLIDKCVKWQKDIFLLTTVVIR